MTTTEGENTKEETTPTADDAAGLPVLALRAGAGGMLMGLANLVPGISGGTMLVASGIYPRFIRAVAEVTTLRFRRASIVVLGSVSVTAVAAIVLLAGTVKDVVVDHRWIMYSLFIGLTLGGAPIVWKMIDRRTGAMWAGVTVGCAAMAFIGLLQGQGSAGSAVDDPGFALFFLAGTAGASAMILPGISGGYLLLVMGMYIPFLSGIEAFKLALEGGDLDATLEVAMDMIVPFGLGTVAGIVVVSNILGLLLERARRPTLGVLLGLLLGAVVGLWPFQQGVAPGDGDMFRGDRVELNEAGEPIMSSTGVLIEPEKYPTEFFSPAAGQVLGSIALIAAGFLATMLIARLGKEKEAVKTGRS